MIVRKVTEHREFAGLRGVWDRALAGCSRPDLFLTFDWFLTWWENLSEGRELNLLVLSDEGVSAAGGGDIGIAPLMRGEDGIRFLAGHEVTDYCDFLFPRGREGLFFEALLANLSGPAFGISRMEFINLRDSSPTLSLLPEAAASFGFRCRRERSEETMLLGLPADYSEYTAGLPRRNRHELRRKVRRAEALPGIRVKRISRPDEVRSAMGDFIALHRAGSPEKESFWQKPGMPEFFRELGSRLAEQCLIELLFLFADDDIPAASLISARFGKTAYFYNVAYASAYAAFSPGVYLFDLAIRQAISEGRETADFLRGREKYKLGFGTRPCSIYSLILER